MLVKNKTAILLLWVLLLGCLVLLARYIVLKKGPYYEKSITAKNYRRITLKERWNRANLTPFATINLYNSPNVSSKTRWQNIGGNILGFVPLGFLLPLLVFFLRRFFFTVGAVFLISLFFEVVQLYTGLGVFDVDDLILNTTGGLLGYLLYKLAGLLVKPHKTAAIVTV